MRRDGEHISSLGLSFFRTHVAAKRTLAMGIFEPLVEHSHEKPTEPRHRRDRVAPILFAMLAMGLLAMMLLIWGG